MAYSCPYSPLVARLPIFRQLPADARMEKPLISALEVVQLVNRLVLKDSRLVTIRTWQGL